MVGVDNADQVFSKALKAGATEKKAMSDQFYGDRSGTLIDPFGHVWTVASHKEDVTPHRRFREATAHA